MLEQFIVKIIRLLNYKKTDITIAVRKLSYNKRITYKSFEYNSVRIRDLQSQLAWIMTELATLSIQGCCPKFDIKLVDIILEIFTADYRDLFVLQTKLLLLLCYPMPIVLKIT